MVTGICVLGAYAYVTLAFQSSSLNEFDTVSTNCSTFAVQSRIHLVSPPITNVPLTPFLLNALISFAPTHFASHTARSVGTFLLRHWSSRTLPRIPCGIVRLSRRSEMLGFARSLSQTSRLVSVRVTRGGGLKVEAEVICPLSFLWFNMVAKTVDKVCRPLLCLSAGSNGALAD